MPARVSNTRAPSPAYGLQWLSSILHHQPSMHPPSTSLLSHANQPGFTSPNQVPGNSVHTYPCFPPSKEERSSLKTQPRGRFFQEAFGAHFPLSGGQQREVTGGHWVGKDGRRPGGWEPWGTFMEARWGWGHCGGLSPGPGAIGGGLGQWQWGWREEAGRFEMR